MATNDQLNPKNVSNQPTNTKPSQAQFDNAVLNIMTDTSVPIEQRLSAAQKYSNETGYVLDNNSLAKYVASGSSNTSYPDTVVTAKKEFAAKDHRVRLSAFPGQENNVYGSTDKSKNLLSHLHSTKGLLFPYSPTISMNQDTSWVNADLEHSNYDVLSFQRASSASISVNAKFSVQNQREGAYTMAAIHFLRTVSKSYFGESDSDQFKIPNSEDTKKVRVAGKAGLPPPVLILSGYGHMLFNNLRVVVKSHSWSFDENSDMIKVDLPIGETVWLPPLLQISITLGMQSVPNDIRRNFSLDDFRSGSLLNSNTKGWF